MMSVNKNPLHEKDESTFEPKTIFIFCEGERTETNYFSYFETRDSRIQAEIYPRRKNEKHDPSALFDIALSYLGIEKINEDIYDKCKNPYQEEIDEVWFVIDTDRWEGHIPNLYNKCKKYDNWNIAHSNPCFEVWLYYHFYTYRPDYDINENLYKGNNPQKHWKSFVARSIDKGGGFNFTYSNHMELYYFATQNSKNNLELDENKYPRIASTTVYKLGLKIHEMLEEKKKLIGR